MCVLEVVQVERDRVERVAAQPERDRHGQQCVPRNGLHLHPQADSNTFAGTYGVVIRSR